MGNETSDREVRAGIQQAKVGEIGFNILSVEAFLFGLTIGIRFQSWGFGIAAFLGLEMLMLTASASNR
jgi:hypothetical protein